MGGFDSEWNLVCPVAGAHANPAVTAAMAVTRNITPLRSFMFITAQCGGGIAGAALLYG